MDDVQSMYLIPRIAQDALSTAENVQIDGQSGYSWTQAGPDIYLWSFREGKDSRLKRLHMLDDCNEPAHVAVLTYPSSQNVTALSCTPSGELYLWFDINQLSDPVRQKVLAPEDQSMPAVSAFAAVAAPVGPNPGFVAVIAAHDGGLYFVQGSPGQPLNIKKLPTVQKQQRSSVSLLGTISNVLKSAYAEAFDPHRQYNSSLPSRSPALQILIIPVDTVKWKILVLTSHSLDCWMVTLGVRGNEELLWSHTLLAVVQRDVGERDARILKAAYCPGSREMLVWAAYSSERGAMSYSLHSCSFQGDVVPYSWDVHKFQLDTPTEEPDSHDGQHYQLEADPTEGRVLVRFPSGAVYELRQGEHVARYVEAEGVRSISASHSAPGHTTWLLLSSSYGVVEIGGEANLDADNLAAQGLVETSQQLSPEQEQGVIAVMEGAMAQVGRGVTPLGLGKRLQSLGVLRGGETVAVLERFATSLVDAVPKHWAQEAAGVIGPRGVTVGSQLEEKGAQMLQLLTCLQAASVADRMLELNPAALRGIWDAAEKLSAITAIWQLNFWQDASNQQLPPPGSTLVPEIVEAAARALQQQHVYFRQLKPWELFYAAPTLTATAFFAALEHTSQGLLASVREHRIALKEAVENLQGLANVVNSLSSAVLGRREELSGMFPAAAMQLPIRVPQPSWLVGPEVRAALERMLEVSEALQQQQHRQLTQSTPPEIALERVKTSIFISETLLSAFHSSLASVDPTHTSRTNLLVKLSTVRSRSLGSLLQDTRLAMKAAAGQLPGGQWAGLKEYAEVLLGEVGRLAEVYCCFEVLFDVEELVGGAEGQTLRGGRMRQVGPPEGSPPSDTYLRYVFQRLYDDGRHVELLQSASEFHEELLDFLQAHPQLLYLLLIRQGSYQEAAACLFDLAQSTPGLVEKKHYMGLAKVSAMAAGASAEHITVAADDVLRLCNLQQRLGGEEQVAMSALQLVDTALAEPLLQEEEGHGQDGQEKFSPAVLAVAALALVQAEDLPEIGSRWEASWRRVVESCSTTPNQYDGEDRGDALRAVSVYQAASSCFGRPVFGQTLGMTDPSKMKEVRLWLAQWTVQQQELHRVVLDAFDQALTDNFSSDALTLLMG